MPDLSYRMDLHCATSLAAREAFNIERVILLAGIVQSLLRVADGACAGRRRVSSREDHDADVITIPDLYYNDTLLVKKTPFTSVAPSDTGARRYTFTTRSFTPNIPVGDFFAVWQPLAGQ